MARDEIELLARFRQDYDRFVAVVNRIVDLIRNGKPAEAHAAQTREARPLADRLERLTNELVNKAEADVVAGIDASAETYDTSREVVLAFVLGSIALALLLGRTISMSLIGPILEIGERLGRIAFGDFHQRVAVANRDEFGALAANVNRTSEQLGRLYGDLRAERERSEELLRNTLPGPILERLRAGETVIADSIPAATILFSDIVDFSELARRLTPEQMIDLLGTLFARFDALAAKFGLEKIKTIGDGYMVAGGVPEPRADHASAVAEMGLAMLDAAREVGAARGDMLRLRIGIHSGPLVAGVIGTHKFVYDVWGETVNTAKRMESAGLPERVHVSAATRQLISDTFRFEARGALDVKGTGTMETFLLVPYEQQPQAGSAGRAGAAAGTGEAAETAAPPLITGAAE